MKITPSKKVLLNLLELRSGNLFWKTRDVSMFKATETRSAEHTCRQWNSRFAGKEALVYVATHGYKSGLIFGTHYYAHRIVFKMNFGTDPHFIDHINGVRSDNRVENLRSVTRSGNRMNSKRRSDNTSGTQGVSWCRHSRKWKAQINANGEQIALGSFTSKEDAITLRKEAEKKYGYHENHGRD